MRLRAILLICFIFFMGIALGLAAMKYLFVTVPETAATIEDRQVPNADPMADADVTAEDVELVQGRDGAMQWRILATSAQYDQDREKVAISNPQLMAHVGEKGDEVYIRAERGEVDQAYDNLSLLGGVDGRFGTFSLSADQLDYVGAIDKVYLKGKVVVKRSDMEIQATAVEIDLNSMELLAAGGVTATMVTWGSDGIATDDTAKE